MKQVIYLIGPIEHDPDYGQSWRREITPPLEAMGYEVLDPTMKSAIDGHSEGADLHGYFKDLAANGQFMQVAKTMREVVNQDLNMQFSADTLLCYWQEDVVSHGTSGEITLSYALGVPVITVAPGGIQSLPLWVQGCVDPYYVVETFEQALDMLSRDPMLREEI